MNVKIESICENLIFLENVTRWIYEEFVRPYRDDLTYEELVLKEKNFINETWPIRFVAIVDDKCVGTVSIVDNDLKCSNYTPWLSGLYVDVPYRNKKIGEQLIEHVKNFAKSLGYKELFLRTEHASGYYKRLGWQYIETYDDGKLKPDVFKFKL